LANTPVRHVLAFFVLLGFYFRHARIIWSGAPISFASMPKWQTGIGQNPILQEGEDNAEISFITGGSGDYGCSIDGAR
jgi:hypothetical protein